MHFTGASTCSGSASCAGTATCVGTPTCSGGIAKDSSYSAILSIAPNPVVRSATITYSIFERDHVSIDVYNGSGIKVEQLLSKDAVPGEYKLEWIPRNKPIGIYYVVLRTSKNIIIISKKVIVKPG